MKGFQVYNSVITKRIWEVLVVFYFFNSIIIEQNRPGKFFTTSIIHKQNLW